MIKFTPYFYKFKSMILDKNIPIEFRAKFLVEKQWSSHWRKMYKYNMYTDDSLDKDNSNGIPWKSYFGWKLEMVSINDVSSILDMDLKHPEIEPSDLVTALILWGREPTIVEKVLEFADVPERDEFMNLVKEAKSWKKEKKLLKDPGWMYH